MSGGFNEAFNDFNRRHFHTRAVGQMWLQPSQKGYENKVLQLTAQELDFKDSVGARDYMERMRKKHAPLQVQSKMRRMRQIRDSDD